MLGHMIEYYKQKQKKEQTGSPAYAAIIKQGAENIKRLAKFMQSRAGREVMTEFQASERYQNSLLQAGWERESTQYLVRKALCLLQGDFSHDNVAAAKEHLKEVLSNLEK